MSAVVVVVSLAVVAFVVILAAAAFWYKRCHTPQQDLENGKQSNVETETETGSNYRRSGPILPVTSDPPRLPGHDLATPAPLPVLLQQPSSEQARESLLPPPPAPPAIPPLLPQPIPTIDEDTREAFEGLQMFGLKEIRIATSAFSESNKVGQGGFGSVYVGRIGDIKVAVKRGENKVQGVQEFYNELAVMAGLDHPNLVKLLGACNQEGEHILVYEYIPNGTLKEHLAGYQSKPPLDLSQRVNLLADTALAIKYLHDSNPPIIHRDVKSNNILLTDTLKAKVADFGLSKLWPDGKAGDSHVSTVVKGTMGYLDPNYYVEKQLTDKSDVFSFGVVMLEVLTGRKAFDSTKGKAEKALVTYAKQYIPMRVWEIVDPKLARFTNDPVSREVIKKLAVLASECVDMSRQTRPRIKTVLDGLERLKHTLQVSDNRPATGLRR